MDTTAERIKRMTTVPSEAKAFDEWLKGKDALSFLETNLREPYLVVYVGYRGIFMHGILAPTSLLTPANKKDLMAWNCNASSGWGVVISYSKQRSIGIALPLDHSGSSILDQGEQLVFARFFEGRLGEKNYMEVLQKYLQVFDLHYLHERNAYCRIDGNGDIEDVIRIVRIPPTGEEWGGTVVTFLRDVLDEYMVLTDTAMVRTFDFTHYRPRHFSGWSNRGDPEYTDDGDLFYRWAVEPGNASYFRGCQIVRPQVSKAEVIGRHDSLGEDRNREYATFIAYDWKNQRVVEISTKPGETANYFTESDRPFETSPAFFRPEVLLKYKGDSEKYKVGDRSITCRGAWYLKGYDVNEAGQVHAYICYLRDLPYQEQLHWKAHNEAPKGPISKRAFVNDFKGQWYLEYDPLNSIRQIVGELRRDSVPWWTCRAEWLIERTQYPVTNAADEWATELLNLDQLLVEGFEERWLRSRAEAVGRKIEPQYASLRLLEEYLCGLGFDTERAREVVASLKELRNLRTKMKGHASGEEGNRLRQEILREFGTYGQHFRVLCQRCDEAFRAIAEAFRKGAQ